MERGQTLYALPAILPKNGKFPRNVRPDLQDAMLAAQILLGSIRQACWSLDQPQTKQAKRSKKSKKAK